MSSAMTGAKDYSAVHSETIGGVVYVACAASCATGPLTKLAVHTWNGTALTTLWNTSAVAYSTLAVKFLSFGGSSYAVFANSAWTGSFGANTTVNTIINYYGLTTGTLAAVSTLPWQTIYNAGAQVTVNGTEFYPLFFLCRTYGALAGPTYLPDFVDDPSVEAWMCHGTGTAVVARFGCVRGTFGPARTVTSFDLLTNSAVAIGSRVMCAYRKDLFGNTSALYYGYPGRYVTIDFAARQPPAIQDRDGTALCAAALPYQWDGVEVAEVGGPLHAPHIALAAVGGSGTALPAGTYAYRAVYVWTDAAGLEHRSRPSVPATVTSAGASKPVIRVTGPDSMRNGLQTGPVQIELYGTVKDVGDTYYMLGAYPSATSAYQNTYDTIFEADTTQKQLYSVTGANGEELFPQPPPPLHDIAVVGSRAYAIDAEVRSRLVVSKIRVAGKGFEFSPALEVNFPSSAGKLMAVREFSGTPIIIAENGVYQISGDGPSNNGVGGFNQPVFLSDMGCSNADSVVRYPGGIMWQKGSYLVRFNGSVGTDARVLLADTVTGAAVLRNQDEVLLFTSAWCRVYNYALDRWSIWDSSAMPVVSNALTVPTDANKALVFYQGTGTIYYVDALTTGGAVQMSWKTGWFVPGGDFQDHTVPREVVFSGRALSPHSLRINLFTNYEDTPTATHTWSASDVAALSENAGGRYTVSLQAVDNNSRAIQVQVIDTISSGTQGVRPIAVTVVSALEDSESLLNEVALLEGSRQ
jgi:hypothetical protein